MAGHLPPRNRGLFFLRGGRLAGGHPTQALPAAAEVHKSGKQTSGGRHWPQALSSDMSFKLSTLERAIAAPWGCRGPIGVPGVEGLRKV